METAVLDNIANSLGNLENGKKLKDLLMKAIESEISVTEIIEKGLRKGLETIGKKYEDGEYFLSELLYGSDLTNGIFEMLKPYLQQLEADVKGTVVIGTVRGDMHDIGKNVFKMFAEASGFKVVDLGVDVDPELFINAVEENKAKILGLSALLTTTISEMKLVLEKLNSTGIRNSVRVILGGNAVSAEFAEEIGADAAVLDAIEGIKLCKEWMENEYK
ncbi:MAG: B12-binding domain-containing protein [Promethearchaeota archaeon]